MPTHATINIEEIIDCLYKSYNIQATSITHLPISADFNTIVYKILSANQKAYFLKIRTGNFFAASVIVPKLLYDQGIQEIISPIVSESNELWVKLDSNYITLYPYINGRNANDIKLTTGQWQQLGHIIKIIHNTQIPEDILETIPKDTYDINHSNLLKSYLSKLNSITLKNPTANKLHKLLEDKQELINTLIQSTISFQKTLQAQSLHHVLCHSDLHGWNLHIDEQNKLYLIDWDTIIFAPKERDLMYIGAGIWDTGCTQAEEEKYFYAGYGKITANIELIKFYRIQRIIQDLAEYCEYIFDSNSSDEDKALYFEYLEANFRPEGTIDRALFSSTS